MSRSRSDNPFDDAGERRRCVGRLADGAATLGLMLPDDAESLLIDYLALLYKWNQAYNLTAVREPEAMVVRLLLDSLSVVPYIKGPRVLDVGSGPGLPGIPLAIAQPGLTVVLLDSRGKKTRFQRQAIAELGLAGVSAEQARVEDFRPSAPFDTVISRAFGRLADLVMAARPLCRPDGWILAMKGRYPEAELDALPPGCRLLAVERLEVPGLDAERWLVRLSPGND